jgi:hypothetical protein
MFNFFKKKPDIAAFKRDLEHGFYCLEQIQNMKKQAKKFNQTTIKVNIARHELEDKEREFFSLSMQRFMEHDKVLKLALSSAHSLIDEIMPHLNDDADIPDELLSEMQERWAPLYSKIIKVKETTEEFFALATHMSECSEIDH